MNASEICFINLDSINVTPYFKYYKELTSEPFDIIYWNRGKGDNSTGARKVFSYNHPVDHAKTVKWAKQLLTGYLGFRRFAENLLSKNNYRVVVLLTGNAAVLLSRVLLKKYKHRYIVDIRDYFLEKNPIYKVIEDKVLDESALNIISSPAYRNFLGDHFFQVMHNTPPSLKSYEPDSGKQKRSLPFVLAAIGTAKNIALDKAVLNYFANDERFHLRFYGRGYEILEEYCKDNNINNATIIGEFNAKQTLSFYQDVDVIMSMYGSKKIHFKYQLTNKLYYSVALSIPILVSPDTYMENVVRKYNLGFALDLNNPTMKEKIIRLYDDNTIKIRQSGALRFKEVVRKDNNETKIKISTVFQSREF